VTAELVEQRLEVDAPRPAQTKRKAQVAAREGTNSRPQRRCDRSEIQILAADPIDGALRQVDVQPGGGAKALEDDVNVFQLGSHRVEEDGGIVRVEGTTLPRLAAPQRGEEPSTCGDVKEAV
jgi:hypothetical protein